MTPVLDTDVKSVNPQPTEDERMWALGTHVGSVSVSIFVPLVVLVVKGRESDWVRRHAIEALNFQIGMLVLTLISIALAFFAVGICGIIAIAFGMPILAIVAGVKAWQGEFFRYPLTLRLIKE